MIYVDNLPDPPEGSEWWAPETLTYYMLGALNTFRDVVQDMRAAGATREDYNYLAELTKCLALRAWDEIEKGG